MVTLKKLFNHCPPILLNLPFFGSYLRRLLSVVYLNINWTGYFYTLWDVIRTEEAWLSTITSPRVLWYL